MQQGDARRRIGIVGAGMAGTSAAYFVRQALGEHAEVVVWEREGRIGGRVREIDLAGRRVSAGASIAHSENRYLVQFVQMLGLQPEVSSSGSGSLGVWNGTGFDVMLSSSRGANLLRTFLRYRLAPLRAERLVRQVISRLVHIYDAQAQGHAFASPRDLFEFLDLYDLSQQTSAEYFAQHGVSERFVRELVDGISRGNYGQDASIHALVNLISLAGAAMGGYLFSVQGGNSQVCRGLLDISKATVRTSTAVTRITAVDAGAGRPSYRVATADGDAETFDAVIVATPLEVADIQLSGFDLPGDSLMTRPYQVTHVTFVVGTLDPAYFGLREVGQLPATIMTRESPAIPFSSIGTWGRSAGSPHTIHKLFSREETSEELLSRLFRERVQTERLVWQAYPVLRPEKKWPPFVLSPGLYYANAMESGISTMETEIIAARNVANLLVSQVGV